MSLHAQSLLHFTRHERDTINEETIELLQPYLELDGFNAAAARNASKAAEGLCVWTTAMAAYHTASKATRPKLDALQVCIASLILACYLLKIVVVFLLALVSLAAL
jgi:dynein heavy chain, axonemal